MAVEMVVMVEMAVKVEMVKAPQMRLVRTVKAREPRMTVLLS